MSTLTVTSAKLHITNLNGLGSSGSSESASIARLFYRLRHGLSTWGRLHQVLDWVDRITQGMSQRSTSMKKAFLRMNEALLPIIEQAIFTPSDLDVLLLFLVIDCSVTCTPASKFQDSHQQPSSPPWYSKHQVIKTSLCTRDQGTFTTLRHYQFSLKSYSSYNPLLFAGLHHSISPSVPIPAKFEVRSPGVNDGWICYSVCFYS